MNGTYITLVHSECVCGGGVGWGGFERTIKSRVLLEKLMVAHPTTKFTIFHETRIYVTM
jgi:hypothetical protein